MEDTTAAKNDRAAREDEALAAAHARKAGQHEIEAAAAAKNAAEHEREAERALDLTKAHEQDAERLLVQKQVNELETHQARQEALQLLVTTQAYEREVRHVVALAKLLGPERMHALRAKP